MFSKVGEDLTAEQITRKLAWFDQMDLFYRRASCYGENNAHESLLLEKERRAFIRKLSKIPQASHLNLS